MTRVNTRAADVGLDEASVQVRTSLVKDFLRMWPREIFDLHLATGLEPLTKSGVYILYKDDQPHYIGKANRLIDRLSKHALNARSRHYLFWNYFSAFVISDKKDIDVVEAILISALPSVLVNGAIPRLDRGKTPPSVLSVLKKLRKGRLSDDSTE